MHGGGKRSVKAKAELRVMIAQLGLVGLSPGETLTVVQRILSSQMLSASRAIAAAAEEGALPDPEENAVFLAAADRAVSVARAALAAGVETQRDSDLGEAAELVAGAVTESIAGVLAALPVGPRTLWGRPLEDYALALAAWALQPVESRGVRPPVPVLPELPVPGPSRVAIGELMPGPRVRRGFDADAVWAAAAEIVDADVVEEDGDVDAAAIA